MKAILCALLLLTTVAYAHATVILAVSRQSGEAVQERAAQLARQLGAELGTAVSVAVLADAAQVEAWLNRYATAELALVESAYLGARPGQFVNIAPVGRELVLIGRQGVGGDLPQRIAAILGGGRERPAATVAAASPEIVSRPAAPSPSAAVTGAREAQYSSSKSADEDRHFVTYVYQEKFARYPEPERLEYWTGQLRSGALSKQQLFEELCQQGLALCRKSN